MLKQALEELPIEFREAVILRELEGLSYKEISHITDAPVERSCRAWHAAADVYSFT